VAGIVVEKQLGDRKAHIPEEALGDLQAPDHSACEYGQIREGVVSAQPEELLPEARGPVLGPGLPAVDVRCHQGMAREGQGVANEVAYEGLEVGLDGLLAELVALQATARIVGGGVHGAGGSMAHAQDHPVPRRRLPRQIAFSIHLLRDVDDGRAGDDAVRRSVGVGGGEAQVPPHHGGLACDILDPVLTHGGHGEDGDVSVVPRNCGRLWHSHLDGRAAGYRRLCPHNALHGMLGPDPRTAAAAPARVVVHVDFEAEAMRLAHNVGE